MPHSDFCLHDLDVVTDASARDSGAVAAAEALLDKPPPSPGAAKPSPATAANGSSAVPLTGVRQELTNLNRQLVEATAALRVASEPVTRLRGFVNRVSEVEALLHGERSAYDDALSAWILAK